MNRDLAIQLKAAGFPIDRYRTGHKFYPCEQSAGWSDAARRHGVIITGYDLQDRLQDLQDGYYCPNLPDLIDACGERFRQLWIEKTIWTAESSDSEKFALANSAEEAVAKLWFMLRRAKE